MGIETVLQEYRNDIRFFEHTGTARAPRYEWRTDRYRDLEVGEWYRFVDLDADGDVDLLAEQPFSNIRFYRNTGTKQAAQFEPGGILNDSDGQPLFLDRQNIPAIVDLKRLDAPVAIHDGDAILAAQKMAAEVGLGVGISAGANLLGALTHLEQAGGDAVAVTVLPDSHKKYLSTDLFRPQTAEPGWISPHIEFESCHAIACPRC